MRAACVFCALLLLSVSVLGCAPREGDYFAPFSGAFSADVTGELYGMPFSAVIEAEAPTQTGERAVTLLFYAPKALADTVLSRDAAGTVTVSVGGVSVESDAAGFAALLSLFPPSGEVSEVALEGERTRVTGEGFSLSFFADGTPAAAENAAARVEVVRFCKK